MKTRALIFLGIVAAVLTAAPMGFAAENGRELVDAAKQGDLPTIEKLLAAAPEKISAVHPDTGETVLEVAAAAGHVAVVEFLLQKQASVSATNRAGQTALHRAAQAGTVAVIPLLLTGGANLEARANDGETPLLTAVSFAKREAVALLLQHHADISAVNKRGEGVLHRFSHHFTAARKEGTELAALLIGANARIDTQDEDGATPMHAAAQWGAVGLAEALFTAHAAIDAPAGANLVTPLHLAVTDDETDFGMVDWLLAHGAATEAKLANGATPLLIAAEGGFDVACLRLLEKGADPKAAYPNGVTVAHFGRLPVVEAVVAHGADVNARNADGATPMCTQAFLAHLDVVQFLLAHGAAFDARDNNGNTAQVYADHARTDESGASLETEETIAAKRQIYHLLKPAGLALLEAAASGDLTAAQAALARDAAAVNWKEPRDEATPLHVAARHAQQVIAELLLAAHADVRACDRVGYTALHYLAVGADSTDTSPVTADNLDAFLARAEELERRKLAITGLLLAAGLDVNARERGGATALDIAAEGGEFALAELLRSRKAQGRISSGEAFLATRLGTPETLKKLLARDRKLVKLKDELGRTLVIYAATYGSLDAIKVLLDAGADVNAADAKGETALHIAARKADRTTVEFLVSRKAAVNARTAEGKTPLDLARDPDGERVSSQQVANYATIAALLETKGAKTSDQLGPMKPKP